MFYLGDSVPIALDRQGGQTNHEQCTELILVADKNRYSGGKGIPCSYQGEQRERYGERCLE